MDAEENEPIEVPFAALSPAALRAVVEEFITRAGTDYGAVERTLDEKVGDVMRQLERGAAAIVFDPAARTTHLVPRPSGRRGHR